MPVTENRAPFKDESDSVSADTGEGVAGDEMWGAGLNVP